MATLIQSAQAYAERIDALSLRERVMIFLAAAAVLLVAYQSMLLDPLLVRQKALSERVQQRQGELNALRQQLQSVLQRRGEDPDAPNRVLKAQLTSQTQDLERRLSERQSRLVTPDRMARLLENMLRDNNQLQIVSLKTLPPVEMNGSGNAQNPAAAGKPAVNLGLYRHGVEITLRGPYLDLLDYVATIEGYKDKFYLGASDLTAAGGDATLRLNLYTISMSSTWITI